MTPLSAEAVSLCDKASESADKKHPQLEERKIEIDFKKIYNDLRTLDYSKVVWRNVMIFLFLHTLTLRGIILGSMGYAHWQTAALNLFYGLIGGLGLTMGAHRLWAHRTFKANLPLRLILAFGQTVAIQNNIYEWSRDHRGHHKFSETDADPHNAMRGFFFSHMGWLMYKKHPDVIKKGKTVNIDDLLEDPVVYYQKKFYIPLVLLLSVIMPVGICMYFWDEPFSYAFTAFCTRYTINLHMTWCINSLAHWVGTKPFDKYIYPVENKFLSMVGMGEGWHNYHHTFPQDYKAAELGGHFGKNFAAFVIESFAKIGWAYDLKTVSKEVVLSRKARTGERGHLEEKQE